MGQKMKNIILLVILTLAVVTMYFGIMFKMAGS